MANRFIQKGRLVWNTLVKQLQLLFSKTACKWAENSPFVFSPLAYRNPCIGCMKEILGYVLDKKQLSYQKLEMILIDAGDEKDDEDIFDVLAQLSDKLNYLMLITDRPVDFALFVDEMYEENGLIVQQLPKSECGRAKGNFVLDFERANNTASKSGLRPDIIYVPVYKKPWEIAENLDIMVPVGYNTLVVKGITLPQQRGCCQKTDRLDREFRKG